MEKRKPQSQKNKKTHTKQELKDHSRDVAAFLYNLYRRQLIQAERNTCDE